MMMMMMMIKECVCVRVCVLYSTKFTKGSLSSVGSHLSEVHVTALKTQIHAFVLNNRRLYHCSRHWLTKQLTTHKNLKKTIRKLRQRIYNIGKNLCLMM